VAEVEWVPPAAERELGMEFYATRSPGADGRLKSTPEAFRVTEISSYPLPDADGAFVVLRLLSRDWEQHELAAAVGRRLGLPPHSLQWSGTKDRRAVAERLFSYRGPLPDRDLGLRDVDLIEAYRARDGLVLGHHYGNSFDLAVEEMSATAERSEVAFRAVDAELRSGAGVPNFFGPQRFGEVRPITHEVGRWIVRGDLARAVEVYLADRPGAGTPGAGDDARRTYAEHHDPVRALREFPPEYRFERTLLDHLARGHSPERALHALSRDLRTLFIHAYQSWLFNRWLSARHERGLPLDRPAPGDRLVRVARDGTARGPESVPVEADNVTECAELVARGRAWVAGPLVGYELGSASSPVDPVMQKILDQEAITPASFRLPSSPDLASRGAWRPVVVSTPPISIRAEEHGVRFRFALPKGCYATVLLREFLKHGAEVGAGPA
jgi:tRNA pseudouridine13 synthase